MNRVAHPRGLPSLQAPRGAAGRVERNLAHLIVDALAGPVIKKPPPPKH
jgi:hypothetical protein